MSHVHREPFLLWQCCCCDLSAEVEGGAAQSFLRDRRGPQHQSGAPRLLLGPPFAAPRRQMGEEGAFLLLLAVLLLLLGLS